MTTRTQPPPDPVSEWEPQEGYRIEWVDDDRSRVATPEERDERKCRRPGCRRHPAMAFLRSNGWWFYCDWHTYGRRIEGDRVLSRRTVPEDDS